MDYIPPFLVLMLLVQFTSQMSSDIAKKLAYYIIVYDRSQVKCIRSETNENSTVISTEFY